MCVMDIDRFIVQMHPHHHHHHHHHRHHPRNIFISLAAGFYVRARVCIRAIFCYRFSSSTLLSRLRAFVCTVYS